MNTIPAALAIIGESFRLSFCSMSTGCSWWDVDGTKWRVQMEDDFFVLHKKFDPYRNYAEDEVTGYEYHIFHLEDPACFDKAAALINTDLKPWPEHYRPVVPQPRTL